MEKAYKPDYDTIRKQPAGAKINLVVYNNRSENQERFDSLLSPLKKQLYQTALILTKNPHAAEMLLADTCRKAARLYTRCKPNHHFGFWISHILLSNFTRRNYGHKFTCHTR